MRGISSCFSTQSAPRLRVGFHSSYRGSIRTLSIHAVPGAMMLISKRPIGHSIRAHKGKTGDLAEKSANSGEGWGPSANCREGTGNFRATEAAIRRLSRSPRRPTGSSRHDGHSRRRGRRHFEPTKIRIEIGTPGSTWDSLQRKCGSAGRRAGFKGIAGLTVIAPEMAQNAVHDPGLRNPGGFRLDPGHRLVHGRTSVLEGGRVRPG